MSVLKRFSDYEHLRCKCGGVIGMYRKGEYTCANCGKEFNMALKCDWLAQNQKTGWIFPMIKKEMNNNG